MGVGGRGRGDDASCGPLPSVGLMQYFWAAVKRKRLDRGAVGSERGVIDCAGSMRLQSPTALSENARAVGTFAPASPMSCACAALRIQPENDAKNNKKSFPCCEAWIQCGARYLWGFGPQEPVRCEAVGREDKRSLLPEWTHALTTPALFGRVVSTVRLTPVRKPDPQSIVELATSLASNYL